MDVQTTSNLLSIPQVAKHLGVEILAIKRQVALGRLRSSQIGDKGKWFVTSEELDRFVAAGRASVGFAVPPNDGAWFEDEWVTMRDLHAGLVRAAELQIPKSAPKNGRGQFVERVRLTLTPQFRAALSGQARTKSKIDYRDAGEQALVNEMRRRAKRPAGRQSKLTVPISTLYESPRQFDVIRNEALGNFTKSGFSIRHEYPRDDVSHNMRSVIFALPYAEFGYDISRIVELAF